MTARLFALTLGVALLLSAAVSHATPVVGTFSGFVFDIKTAGEAFFTSDEPVQGSFTYDTATTTGGPIDAFHGVYLTGAGSTLQAQVGADFIGTGTGPLNVTIAGGSAAPSAVFHVDAFGRIGATNTIAGSSTFLNLVGVDGSVIPGPALPTTTEFNVLDIDQAFGGITLNGTLAAFYLVNSLTIQSVDEPPSAILLAVPLLALALLLRQQRRLGVDRPAA